MPIRWRPEAGYLLALASGRLLARMCGGERVMLLRRRPREVYRVYTEEEYLNGAGSELAGAREWPEMVEPAGKGAGERRRLRRAAGVAMLAGAMGTVGGVVATNGSRAHDGTGRRPGNMVAATSSKRIVRAPLIARSTGTPSRSVATRPPQATSRRPPQATSRRVAPAGRHRGAAGTRLPLHPREGVASVVENSSGASADRAPVVVVVTTTPVASADVSTTAGSTGASAASAGAGRPEFGFER